MHPVEKPIPEELRLSALAHLLGFPGAIVVLIANKGKSRYVRFQAAQAFLFDLVAVLGSVLMVAWLIMVTLGLLFLAVTDIAFVGNQGNPLAESLRTMVAGLDAAPILITLIMITSAVAIFAMQLVVSIKIFRGMNYHYPWLGKRLEMTLAGEL